jgi:hypothetical protein
MVCPDKPPGFNVHFVKGSSIWTIVEHNFGVRGYAILADRHDKRNATIFPTAGKGLCQGRRVQGPRQIQFRLGPARLKKPACSLNVAKI